MPETATRLPAAGTPPAKALFPRLSAAVRATALRRLGLTPEILEFAQIVAASAELTEAVQDQAVLRILRDPVNVRELAMLLRVAAEQTPPEPPVAVPSTSLVN